VTTWWHQERLRAVLEALAASGAARVLDLGCGAGDLILPLLDQPQIAHITGVEQDRARLETLCGRLPDDEERVRLLHGSITTATPALAGFDAAVLVEVIEHLDRRDLAAMERAVFGTFRPETVIVTTPNAEFNQLLGVPLHRFRHPGHRFEWSRSQFRDWAGAVALRHGYRVEHADIGGAHPDLGGASQMATFRR
jgi:3' terminal RNA ribose 2'-O-methyltransferase Hen1